MLRRTGFGVINVEAVLAAVNILPRQFVGRSMTSLTHESRANIEKGQAAGTLRSVT